MAWLTPGEETVTMRFHCSPAHQNLTPTVGAVVGGQWCSPPPTPARFAAWQNCTYTTLGPEITLHSIAGRAGVGSSLGVLALGVGKVVESL